MFLLWTSVDGNRLIINDIQGAVSRAASFFVTAYGGLFFDTDFFHHTEYDRQVLSHPTILKAMHFKSPPK